MEKDELLTKNYKELMDGISATEETRDRVLGIADSETVSFTRKASQSGRRSGRMLKYAAAACLVLAITGLGTLGVFALTSKHPLTAYFPQSKTLEEGDTVFTESDIIVGTKENKEYSISYDGLIYDDVLKVGYLSVFCSRNDGQPVTDTSVCRNKIVSPYFEGTLKGLISPNLSFNEITAGDVTLYVFTYPAASVSTFLRLEDNGVRTYIKLLVDDNRFEDPAYDFQMAVLTEAQYNQFVETAQGMTSPEENMALLTDYGMSAPEYTSAYLRTVSNDLVTAKIGRTDVRAEWNAESGVDSIVIVREDGSELTAVENGQCLWNVLAGENVRMGYGSKGEGMITTMIIPYGDILREDETVRIKVNGEVVE